MLQPSISIIVPIYKAEKYIRRCVDSILSQTYSDFEVLLVDDGSPDNSGRICDEYAAMDNRVRVFHKKNGGVSSARNFGLDKSVGEIILFADSDDWFADNSFDVIIRLVKENDFIQYSFQSVYASGRTFRREKHMQDNTLDDALKNFTGTVWSVAFKKSIIENHRLRFNENLKLAEDQLFALEYMSHCTSYYTSPCVLYSYYQNRGSAMHSAKYEAYDMSCKAIHGFIAHQPLMAEYCKRLITFQIVEALLNKNVTYRQILKLYENHSRDIKNDTNKFYSSFQALYRINPTFATILMKMIMGIKRIHNSIFYR